MGRFGPSFATGRGKSCGEGVGTGVTEERFLGNKKKVEPLRAHPFLHVQWENQDQRKRDR